MVGQHHRLNAYEFEQALEDGEGQGILACCSPWGRKELDRMERLKNGNMKSMKMSLSAHEQEGYCVTFAGWKKYFICTKENSSVNPYIVFYCLL